MQLVLERRGGLFSKDYVLMSDESAICVMRFDDWKRVEFLIEGRRYVGRADRRGRWTLESGGISIASCERQETGPRLMFSIGFDGRAWLFKPRREGLMPVHDIWEDDCVVGQVTRKMGWWSSSLRVAAPETARVEVVSFAIWLIGIHWTGIAGKLVAARAEQGL